jgi:hypothetical protein
VLRRERELADGPDDRPREQARQRRGERGAHQHEQREHDPQATEHRVDAVERAAQLHRSQALDRDRDDAEVHAVGRAVAEERDAPALCPGRRHVATGDPDRQPALAIARNAIGPDDLRELGRPARAPGWRGRRAAAQGADALHELALRAQAAVDLRAQLAAHGQVADERRQRDRDAHGDRGHEHEAPAQAHGCSRST